MSIVSISLSKNVYHNKKKQKPKNKYIKYENKLFSIKITVTFILFKPISKIFILSGDLLQCCHIWVFQYRYSEIAIIVFVE